MILIVQPYNLQTNVQALISIYILRQVGILMPRAQNIAGQVMQRLTPVTTTFLLPLYFALSGLRTQVVPLRHNRHDILGPKHDVMCLFGDSLG